MGLQAAIVAQVAITALSLENLGSVHWTAKAAFVLSLTTGALSVFFACLLQQRVSSLFGLSDLKDWLSKPAGNRELREADYLVRHFREARDNHDTEETAESNSENKSRLWLELERELTQMVNKRRWERASFSAALMIKIPALLLNWSVGAFLVGLGVYLGSFWTRHLDSPQPRSSSLGVLVTYIVITAAGLLLFFVPVLLKYLESAPIRRFVERVVEREDPKDKPPRLNINDIFDKFDKEPAYPPPRKAKPGERLEVDEYYQVPRNESRASLSQVSATPSPRVRRSTDGLNASVREGTKQDEQAVEPKVEADASQSSRKHDAIRDSHGLTVSPPLKQATEPPQTQSDPLVATLEASILAQEQNIASFRALLQEHQKLLGLRHHALS